MNQEGTSDLGGVEGRQRAENENWNQKIVQDGN
jgi:hypothetical protein